MYSRHARFHLKPGTLDQAIDLIMRRVNAPGQKGFVRGMIATNDDGTLLDMRSMWRTKEDALAIDALIKQGPSEEMAALITAPPVHELFHVRSVDVPFRGGDVVLPRAVRTTSVTVDPAQQDEADRIWEEDILPTVQQLPHLVGVTFLEDRASGRRVSVTLWDSEEAARALEQNGTWQAQVDKLRHLLQGKPEVLTLRIKDTRAAPGTVTHSKMLGHRVYKEVFEGGNLDLASELFAEDYQENSANPIPGLPTHGVEAVTAFVSLFRSAFPDLRVDIEELAVEGDLGIGRVTMRGTHRGEFMGIPPTGREVAVQSVDVVRFRDGKIAEHVGVFDQFALLQQLGVIPEPAAQQA